MFENKLHERLGTATVCPDGLAGSFVVVQALWLNNGHHMVTTLQLSYQPNINLQCHQVQNIHFIGPESAAVRLASS